MKGWKREVQRFSLGTIESHLHAVNDLEDCLQTLKSQGLLCRQCPMVSLPLLKTLGCAPLAHASLRVGTPPKSAAYFRKIPQNVPKQS